MTNYTMRDEMIKDLEATKNCITFVIPAGSCPFKIKSKLYNELSEVFNNESLALPKKLKITQALEVLIRQVDLSYDLNLDKKGMIFLANECSAIVIRPKQEIGIKFYRWDTKFSLDLLKGWLE